MDNELDAEKYYDAYATITNAEDDVKLLHKIEKIS